MTLLNKPVVNAAILLGVSSLVGMGLVTCVHHGTENRIADNQRYTLLHLLQTLLPPGDYDNDILADVIEVTDSALNTTRPVPVYRARFQGKPVAVVIAPTAPDGYSGEIKLLVAIRADGSLAGVRVVSHKETPGLGDLVDVDKSRWVLGFNGLSLGNPAESRWKVKRDGGAFDQFAGATITPRAVVKAVKSALSYFQDHSSDLFQRAADGAPVEFGDSL